MSKSSCRPWIALLVALASFAGLLVSDHAPAKAAPRVRSAKKISAEVQKKVSAGQGNERVRVIVQPREAWNSNIDSAVEGADATNIRQFQKFNFRVLTVSASAAAALAARDDVAYVSVNKEVRTLGHVSLTTGADAVREISGTNTNGLDGTGIGIAVLDSGVDTDHKAFLDRSNNLRVIVNRDFTGEGRLDDPYGHGTHVASMAAGNGRISNGQYTIGSWPTARPITSESST